MYHCYRTKKKKAFTWCDTAAPKAPKVLYFTYIGGGSKFISVLIELPGCCWVHLDQGDTTLTPHILGLFEGEEGAQQEVHDAPRHRPRICSQPRQEMLRGTDTPEL